ncbi:DUF302 domain-containing protein [Luteitalea sp.]|jgi:uncharacterized protein (DUF302 family)
MTTSDPAYGYTTHLAGVAFDDARARTVEALKAEGFGVLTEIDVTATLKTKLDKDFRRYVILGACNPHLAYQALTHEIGMGLLLPCNVAVWEEDGGSVVSIAKPAVMFDLVQVEALTDVAADADARLQRALVAIGR